MSRNRGVTTERIIELRNRYMRIDVLMAQYEPQEVFRTNQDLKALLAEVLEYREAEEESGKIPELQMSATMADEIRISLLGTVS